MRVGKHWVLWLYRAGLSRFASGSEHEHDPDVFTAWFYLGLFGVALSWCRDGWLYPREATRDRAVGYLAAAPDPQCQTVAFSNAWDEFDRQ